MDWVTAMNDYHDWAFPCARIRAGNVHDKIAERDAATRPRVADFNYTQLTTRGTSSEQYERGSFPQRHRQEHRSRRQRL